MNIYVAVVGIDPALADHLRAALSGHNVHIGDPKAKSDADRHALSKADIIFGKIAVERLVDAPKLRWLQLETAGAEPYLGINSARSGSPVVITKLEDFFGRAVGETALAGILAHYHHLPRLLAAQKERRWINPEIIYQIGQLHGAKVIILGAGSLGRRLTTLLQAFECDVRVFARTAPSAQLHTLAELDAALPTADIVINALPHTPHTDGLINKVRLALLPHHALLVNVGRGTAVDESALVAALDAGKLAGAILDVTVTEPLPADSPLWTHPRVILTQHTGGRFPHAVKAKVDYFIANFERYIHNQPLKGLVVFSSGY